MKRIIFPLFVLPLVMALASCGLNPAPEGDDASSGVGGGDEDGSRHELQRYVTFRLADAGEYVDDTIGIVGGVGLGNVVSNADTDELANSPKVNSRSESRALTFDNAQASHEIFEVVFFYKADSAVNHKIARTVWNVGETPELRGVYRMGGVDYGKVNSTSGASDTGYAMLFTGTKADKTLLGIGKLVEVDGMPGNTTLNADTVSVTFEVSALRAGTSATAANSSFLTNFTSTSTPANPPSAARTGIYSDIFIHYGDGKKRFPLYRLTRPDGSDHPSGVPNRETTLASYTFYTTPTGDLSDYANGIVLAGGYNFEVRNPRYIITNGLYQYSSIFVQDLRHGLVDMTNNTVPVASAPAPPNYNYSTFAHPVNFEIVTTNSPDGSIFALAFEIFVNNLTPRPTSTESLTGANDEPIKWRISPGTGTKWLDLDDGNGGEGGAILLGSGKVREWLVPYGYTITP